MTSVFVVVVVLFLVELCFQGAVRKTCCPLGGDIIFMGQFLSHQKWEREREGRGATAFSTIIITQFDPIMWTFYADGLVERLFLKMLL